MAFLSGKWVNTTFLLRKFVNMAFFVANFCKYALIDSFQGYSAVVESSASCAALCHGGVLLSLASTCLHFIFLHLFNVSWRCWRVWPQTTSFLSRWSASTTRTGYLQTFKRKHNLKCLLTMMMFGFYNFQNRTTGSLPDKTSFLCRMVWNKDCTL